MSSTTRYKGLLQLGLCLLLMTGFTLWSASWSAPAFHEGQVDQLGDSSPSFLVDSGDNPSGDDPYSVTPQSSSDAPVDATSLLVGMGVGVVRRIRIVSYPVLPQAPPALT